MSGRPIPWNSNFCTFCERSVNRTSMSYRKAGTFKCARCCRIEREAKE